MKNNFDAILASTPLDSTAAKVTSRGTEFKAERPMPPGFMHWDAPPPMRAVIASPNSPDLTGKKFGRFTVVGLLDAPSGNKGSRWVCKCLCGDYEARNSKAIRMALAGLSDQDGIGFRCWNCASWSVIQSKYKRKGSAPISSFTQERKKPENRSPDNVIAKVLGENDATTAIKIVAALNSAGFRIVRGQN